MATSDCKKTFLHRLWHYVRNFSLFSLIVYLKVCKILTIISLHRFDSQFNQIIHSLIYFCFRYYVQLPTEKAHLYHDVDTANLPPLPEQICFTEDHPHEEEDTEELGYQAMQDVLVEDGVSLPESRLHPLVAEKICELVAQGHDQVYTVRKQLRYDSDGFQSVWICWKIVYCSSCECPGRRFVEREMFKSEEVPERHNLCYFPTVNDIKNHIHEAQKTLGPLDASDTEVWTENTVCFWRSDHIHLKVKL